jgi:hypothetical protein
MSVVPAMITLRRERGPLMNTVVEIKKESMVDVYVDKYRQLVLQATLSQMEQASVWYRDAEEVAEEVARNLDSTLEVGASVVSAFSPRERWSTNVAKAISFSLGHDVKGLKNNTVMANSALQIGFEALKGPKTNAFARAIAGDPSAIVIDVWMCKAVDDELSSPSKKQYVEMTQAVNTVAKEFKITPRTCQALIWIVKRGSAF